MGILSVSRRRLIFFAFPAMKDNIPANVVNKHVKAEVIICTVTVNCDFYLQSFMLPSLISGMKRLG